METILYFIRHARSDTSVRDERSRPLTPDGLEKSKKVAKLFEGEPITAIWSSPYKRSVQTVTDTAAAAGLEIRTDEGFRERRVETGWIEDFKAFSLRQWSDFEFRLEGGECLREVQERNVAALHRVLDQNPGGRVLVGSHGTALSTIVRFYDPGFGYEDFWTIIDRMPWIVRFRFDGHAFLDMEEIRLPGVDGIRMPR